jgi:hypothetical protein
MTVLAVALAALVTGLPDTDCPSPVNPTQDVDTANDAPSSFWAFLPADGPIRRCQEDSPEVKAATEGLRALGQSVRDLAPQADPAPVVAQMRALLHSPCLHPAYEQGEPRDFTHAIALKTWWEDGGGHWLGSYLSRPRYGRMDALREHVVLPPEPRKVLTLETAPDHRLASLLCPAADDSCGSETRGWAERARVALEAPDPSPFVPSDSPTEPDAISSHCLDEARKQSPTPAYGAWLACVDQHFPTHWALPLGRFRAPTSGWLTVRGRRGHYDFCDEVRAYDLATGAAYVAASCSGLNLRTDGTVDFQKTDASRAAQVRVGRVNSENLREAAWMMLFAPEAQDARIRSLAVPLPKGMEPTIDRSAGVEGGISGGGYAFNTSQTRLEWLWTGTQRQPAVEGELTWPNSYRRNESHAAVLLDIAERGMTDGCPPAPLSEAAVAAGGAPGVSRLDAEPEVLSEVQASLVAALRAYRPPAECQPVASRPQP